MSNGLLEQLKDNRCVLCGGESVAGYYGDSFRCNCERCGQYRFTRSGLVTIGEQEMQLLPYLSFHTRQASDRGDVVTLHSDNWREIAHSYEQTPLSVKTNRLLELIASNSRPGQAAKLSSVSAPLVYAYDASEWQFLIEHMRELGFLEEPSGKTAGVKLKAKGWEYVQSVQAQKGVLGKCFVAMSFDKSLADAWRNGIEPALRNDCKMDPIRMDRIEHNEKICDKIIVEIRSSEFLIADVTLQRPGVYFEAGYAMGLSRPVIWSCRKDEEDKIHFDTRQYNHVFWETPEDLREQLKNRVLATIKSATPPHHV